MSRKEKLLALLEADPNDPFLHYALAKEFLSEGDNAEGRRRLADVIERFPDYHAAHFQLGQLLAEAGETDAARKVVEDGVVAARQAGDAHAVAEMSGFLEAL